MLSKLLTTKEQTLLAGCAAAICVGGVAYYFAAGTPATTTIAPVTVKEVVVPAPPPEKPTDAVTPSTVQAVIPTDVPPVKAPVARLRVSVAGAVASPGVYEFDAGDRVSDAVKAAGGVLEYADVSDINQAATLVDGSTLVIPQSGRAAIEDGKRMVLRAGQSAAALNPVEYTISGWAGKKTRAVSSAVTSTQIAVDANPAESGDPLDINSATLEELETLPGVGPKTASAIIEYRKTQPFQSVDDLDNVPGIGEKKLEDLRPHVRVGN